jgi:hypothetical protein
MNMNESYCDLGISKQLFLIYGKFEQSSKRAEIKKRILLFHFCVMFPFEAKKIQTKRRIN